MRNPGQKRMGKKFPSTYYLPDMTLSEANRMLKD